MTHQSFQDKVRTRKITREVFVNDNGAIDLASIMVGIIVIGLIGAIIAATIFAVIPWAQDNAAKQQLDSIKSAEDAYRGLAEDSGISEYGNNLQLAKPTFKGKDHPSLIDLKEIEALITTTPGPNPTYTATIKSASGKTFTITNGKISEVKNPPGGGTTNPPVSGDSVSLTEANMFPQSTVSQVTMPSDKAGALAAQATVVIPAEDFTKLQKFFTRDSFTDIGDTLRLPDGVDRGYSSFSGQGDVYMSRPSSVVIKDLNNTVVAEYSGEQGSMFYYYNISGTYGWALETAVSESISKQLPKLKGYNIVFNYDGFTLSASGSNYYYFEPGPVGNGTDTASAPFTTTSVDYVPIDYNRGQGYKTQAEYDDAMNNHVTNYWGVRFTIENPDSNILPDLSDVPLYQNADGTYTAYMTDGRAYTQPYITLQSDGERRMVSGTTESASFNANVEDFYGDLEVTLDSNKKVISMKTDYMAVHLTNNPNHAEAVEMFRGAKVEMAPYGLNDKNGYKVTNPKPMIAILN